MAERTCAHIEVITTVKRAKRHECDECVKIGARWVHLRTCHPDFAQKMGYRLSKNKESIGRISRENEPFPLTVFRPSEAQWSHSTVQEVNDEANSY
jgi:hypothetical protein